MRGFRSGSLGRLAAVCLGSTALALTSAIAAVVDYPDGSNNASPIVLTDNSTQLQVLTGSATQSGAISEFGGSYSITKTGSGTLSLSAINTYSGETIISAGTLALSGSGSIANSSNIALNANTLDISGTTNGASVKSLFSLSTSSTILLGSKTLTVTSGIPASGSSVFFGNISGTGGVTISGGSQTFAGVNTYSGTTTIANGATLSLSNLGSIANSAVVNNGVLNVESGNAAVKSLSGSGALTGAATLTITNASGVFSGSINNPISITGGKQTFSGSGSQFVTLSVSGGATAALIGSGSFPGDTIAVDGIFDISGTDAGATVQHLTGSGSVLLGAKTLTLTNVSGTGFPSVFFGTIGGTGLLNFSGFGGTQGVRVLAGNNTYTGGTIIGASSTLQIGNGGITGSIVGNVVNSGTLAFNRSDTVTYAGSVSGSGSLRQSGSGTLILTGTNTHLGTTRVASGTLQIGNGGTTGSVSGNISNFAALAFNRSDNLTYAGVVDGTGTLTKLGAGTLTLSGATFHSGVTTVSAGTLNITGALNNSNTSVANSGALTGIGSVRNVTVASGGTAGPLGTGTLTVQGNLTLNAGSTYADSITPSTAGLINVSGAAGLNGTAVISAGAGTYSAGQRYTLLNADGGVSGTFSSLTMLNLPGNVRGALAYDATRVYLDLKVNAITPLLPSGASTNQTSVAAGIDAGLQQGTVLNSGFTALFNLQGAALGNALNQIAGQGAPNIATAGSQSLTPFLSVMQGQGAFGGDDTDTAANFAPGNVYGDTGVPRRAQLAPGAMRVWGSVYGGHAGISANATTGAASLSASNVGFVAGAEVSLTDDFRLGASAGFGTQDFSSANSTGDSDDVMLGLYARQDVLENGYVSAAFAYSWHDIATRHTITVAGTDVLGARFDAHAIGGRIESGWRLSLGDAFGFTPFFAFAGDNFYAPAYAESAVSGSSDFALSYASGKTGQKHTEFGAHLDHAIHLGGGDMLSADARAAWAHQLDDAPFVTATFQGLPGSTFRLLGVRAAADTALLGLGLKIRNPDGLDVGLRMDSQIGAGTTVLQGMGTVSWRW